MELPIPQIPSLQSRSTLATKTEGNANELAGDFDTFLKLLTSQMRNQDPLKPTDSTEFVAQLANFSGVEQQVRTNDGLERIFDLLSGSNADAMASWIGREVRAPGKADFAGDPINVTAGPVADSDKTVLVVTNDFNQVVARRTINPVGDTLVWNGRDASGAELPHGSYGFVVESYRGDTLLETQPGLVFSRVTEVRLSGATPELVLVGGDTVALDAITAIR